MDNLGKRLGVTDTSVTNRMQKIEEIISGIENPIEEIYTSIKENTKYKNLLTQNNQEIKDTMKRSNLRIIGMEEGEDSQHKGPKNIFNKNLEENIPSLKKGMHIKVQ